MSGNGAKSDMDSPLFEVVERPCLFLDGRLQKIYERLDLRIARHDHMAAKNNLSHYFFVGSSAISIIDVCISLSGNRNISSILDFASGAGRVTRWIKAAFPASNIIACDIRDADLTFQRDILGVPIWKSTSDFRALKPPQKFDLIWVGSLLSHLCEDSANLIMAAFMDWLNPGGILVVTFHGRRVQLGQTMRRANYISSGKFETVERDYLERGFGYQDYDHQKGLGFSLIKPQWFFDFVSRKVDWKVLGIFEAAWDSHHDVCAIQNSPICVGR